MSLMSHGYATEESFKLYVNYLAMKKHFTTDNFDYHKYNGKIRATFEKYMTRPDVYFFHKLSKTEDPHNRMLSNMVVKPTVWIRDIVEDAGEERYTEWKKKMDSLSYLFKGELNKLNEDYKANFVSVDGQHPYIMSLYLQKQISLETFTILASSANIFPYWSENVVDKIVARDIIRLSRKYMPFLDINQKKYKDIIRDRFL